ncbi:MAG: 5'-nucleotidase C-terminal domain-containing protein [Firmicutes bacterium]|nr:5'-nucleotidase C-terminal domain-containing protein [Bacillota bacterium]
MKKILSFFIIILTTFLLVGCAFFSSSTTTSSSASTTTTTTTSTVFSSTDTSILGTETIDLYSINDYHGGAYSDLSDFYEMSEFLYNQKATNEAVIMATGDMFQGTALSNYYYGLPFVKAFNYIGLDAFTIGNHEFDWGIDIIKNYADSDLENGEADYPFLAANIVYKDTQEMLPWTTPYKVVTVKGVKVGIIGIIGDVIGSISASKVSNIEFLDQADTVYQYAEILRTTEDCDIVVASIHDYNSSMNEEIAGFTGVHLVDAIFNGHTHTDVASFISRTGVRMPYAQVSSKYFSLIAKISLVYDFQSESVISAESYIIGTSVLGDENAYVNQLINVFADDEDYVDYVTEVLAIADDSIDTESKNDLANWAATVIKDYLELDFGVLNYSGVRKQIYPGEITMGDLVEVMPFDNYIKTVYLTGETILDLMNDDYLAFNYHPDTFLVASQLYKVGVVDFVFDMVDDYGNPSFDFAYGENIVTTTVLIRNLLAEDLRNTTGDFDPINGTSYDTLNPVTFSFRSSFYLDILKSIL